MSDTSKRVKISALNGEQLGLSRIRSLWIRRGYNTTVWAGVHRTKTRHITFFCWPMMHLSCPSLQLAQVYIMKAKKNMTFADYACLLARLFPWRHLYSSNKFFLIHWPVFPWKKNAIKTRLRRNANVSCGGSSAVFLYSIVVDYRIFQNSLLVLQIRLQPIAKRVYKYSYMNNFLKACILGLKHALAGEQINFFSITYQSYKLAILRIRNFHRQNEHTHIHIYAYNNYMFGRRKIQQLYIIKDWRAIYTKVNLMAQYQNIVERLNFLFKLWFSFYVLLIIQHSTKNRRVCPKSAKKIEMKKSKDNIISAAVLMKNFHTLPRKHFYSPNKSGVFWRKSWRSWFQ